MNAVTAEGVIALVLLLLTAVLGVRHALRAKCLGYCSHCPKAGVCAAEQREAAAPQET